MNEITGDHQCEFPLDKSTVNQTFCIRYILQNKWIYNGKAHHLFIDNNTAQVLHNILGEFGITYFIPTDHLIMF